MASNSLQAIVYNSQNHTLEILDQLLLPHHSVYIPIKSPEDGFHAIKDMRVRGAPAIAIVAALSVAVEQSNSTPQTSESAGGAAKVIKSALSYLFTSRPTAVNLGDAVRKLTALVERIAGESGSTAKTVRDAYVAAAEQMLVDDVSDNEAIGRHGADWIHKHVLQGSNRKVGMLTVCNTGSLATAGYGTALGVIRSLHADSRLTHAYYCETRPYNQGSRLTGYELLYDKIPCTLITDSMACSLLSTRTSDPKLEISAVKKGKVQKRAEALWAEDLEASSSGKVESRPLIGAIVVGADRVVANGDTANKIGTYSLAVLARHHGVKFLVAAPRTTIDLNTPSGAHIEIEERKEREVLVVKGPVVTGTSATGKVVVDLNNTQEVSLAPLDTEAWNPAFDVTPAELIDGIVTELGVVEKGVDGKFDLARLFARKEVVNGDTKEMPDPVEGP